MLFVTYTFFLKKDTLSCYLFSIYPKFLKLRISKDFITRDKLCDFCNWKFKDAPVTL